MPTVATFEPPIIGELSHLGWYEQTAVPWWVTRNKPAYRTIIADLLPEALEQQASHNASLGYVLIRWQFYSHDTDVRDVARMLDQALVLIERKQIILSGAFIGGCVMIYVLINFILRIMQS